MTTSTSRSALRIKRAACLTLVTLLAVSRGGFAQPTAQGHTTDCLMGTSCLDAAYAAGRRAGHFDRLREELRNIFSMRDIEDRRRGVEWLGKYRRDMPDSLIDQFETLYVEVNPGDDIARSFRDLIALRRLRHSPRKERLATYEKAVKDGQVSVGGTAPLTRAVAFGRAAEEGMTELAPAIRQYAAELDANPAQRGVKNSKWLIWSMTLRAGAVDSEDARRLHLERLEEMTQGEFKRLMDEDAAFRSLNVTLAVNECEGRSTSAECGRLRAIVARQIAARKTIAAYGGQSTRPPEDGTANWNRLGIMSGWVSSSSKQH